MRLGEKPVEMPGDHHSIATAHALRISEHLLEHAEEMDFQYILEEMTALCGARFGVLNLFDPDGLTFRTVAVMGTSDFLRKGMTLLGFNPLDKKWEPDPKRNTFLQKTAITRYASLSDLVGDVIPRSISNLLAQTFQWGEVLLLKVASSKQILGDFTMMMKKGDKYSHSHAEILTLCLYQMGNALYRYRSAENLLYSRRFTRAIIETSKDGFWIVDAANGHILDVNETYCRLSGYQRSELLAMKITDLDVDETPAETEQHLRKIQEVGSDRFQSRHRRKDGVLMDVEITVTWMDGEQPCIICFFRDISSHLAAEKALRIAKEHAEAASKAKSQFLANMSHEIRTPLNGIIGFMELIKDTPMSSVQKQYIDYTYMSGKTLLGIINDILDFSKIEAGMMSLEPIQTDMHELLENSVEIIRHAAEKKPLKVLLDMDPSMPRHAMVDPIRLQQILGNLLGNAVKFTGQGEVKLEVSYEAVSKEQGTYSFFVHDTGIGISEAQLERLFKAFSQADSSTTRKFGGTGLGLVISDRLAQQMGSKIHIESTQGVGSTFHFSLTTDILVNGEIELPPLEDLNHRAVADNKKVTILIADDVHMNMMLIKAMILRLLPDAVLLEAENGVKAVEMYRASLPDLILMDVQMPEMDGIEATKAIRAIKRDDGRAVPIIALTAGVLKEEKERCLAAGMNDFLAKPLEADRLKAMLEKAACL